MEGYTINLSNITLYIVSLTFLPKVTSIATKQQTAIILYSIVVKTYKLVGVIRIIE